MPASFVYKRRGRGGPFYSELVWDYHETAGLGPHYHTVSAQLENELGGHRVKYTFKERNGRPALVRLEITSDNGAEITCRALRLLTRTNDVYEFLRRHILLARQTEPASIIGYEVTDALADTRRDGRKGYPDEWYLPFVLRYLKLIDKEGDRRPIATMSEETGETIKFIEDVIRRARKRGLLTDPPRPGIAGGELTEKARALIAAQQR